MKKKVLQISKYYYPYIGGTEQVARDIAIALKGEAVEHKIICFNEDSQTEGSITHKKETTVDIVDGIEVVRCGCFARVASQSLSTTYARELKKIFVNFQPDVVVFHYPNPFVASFLMKHLRKEIKFVLYWHLDITKQKVLGKLFHGQIIRLLNRADQIIATSPNYIEGSPYLSQYKHKAVVVPNCINETRLQVSDEVRARANELKEKYTGKTLCFAVGRHVPYKGYTYLVKASKLLDDSFRIIIGGKGELTEKLVAEAMDDSKIEFVGRVEDTDLMAYYLACDIFCFPSITKNEAFGIALAEGMFFEKPAVTFTINGSGVNYVSIKDVTGIECPNADYHAYANALKQLSSDDKLREKLGKAAKQRVLDNFTHHDFINNIKEVLLG